MSWRRRDVLPPGRRGQGGVGARGAHARGPDVYDVPTAADLKARRGGRRRRCGARDVSQRNRRGDVVGSGPRRRRSARRVVRTPGDGRPEWRAGPGGEWKGRPATPSSRRDPDNSVAGAGGHPTSPSRKGSAVVGEIREGAERRVVEVVGRWEGL